MTVFVIVQFIGLVAISRADLSHISAQPNPTKHISYPPSLGTYPLEAVENPKSPPSKSPSIYTNSDQNISLVLFSLYTPLERHQSLTPPVPARHPAAPCVPASPAAPACARAASPSAGRPRPAARCRSWRRPAHTRGTPTATAC